MAPLDRPQPEAAFAAAQRRGRRPAVGRVVRPGLDSLHGAGPCRGTGDVHSLGQRGARAFLAFVYGLGVGLPFLISAVALTKTMRVMGWTRLHAHTITRVG
ncbi:hypothetical protein [Allosalinactinospora lopnorensis]